MTDIAASFLEALAAIVAAIVVTFAPNVQEAPSVTPPTPWPIVTAHTDPDSGTPVEVVQTAPDPVFGPWRCTRPDGSQIVLGGFTPVPVPGVTCELEQ